MDVKKQKRTEIRKELEKIIDELEQFPKAAKGLHEVEGHIFKRLLELGKMLLCYYIFMVSEFVKLRGVPLDKEGKKMKNTGVRSRQYRSIFGLIEIKRPKYYSPTDKTHYVLDKELGLPDGRFSYILHDWLAYGAVDLDFDQSVNFLEKILGQHLSGIQSSRVTYKCSAHVSDFYAVKDWGSVNDGTHLSVGFDGKGVPIIRKETERSEESTSTRLGRGKKKGVKKEATVSVSSSFNPKQRTSADIINSLFRNSEQQQLNSAPKEKHEWHKEKHIRAFLSDKVKAIEYGIENVLKRDASGTKPIVVLIDGDRALRNAVEKVAVEKKIEHRIKTYVLDFIHVLEYVWKVANAYKGEKSKDRESWVEQQAILLLDNRVEEVIEEWEKIASIKSYSTTQALNIKKGITYFKNHIEMMKYKTYLEEGFPITTGAVESACGHFVKSRMERNAMHWGKEGAQKMLDIRAVKKNGDWEPFIHRFINQEQKKLYKKAA